MYWVKFERRMSDNILYTVDKSHASVISTITCIALLKWGVGTIADSFHCSDNTFFIPNGFWIFVTLMFTS